MRYSGLEALKQDPNNATLYYNLGVVSSEQEKKMLKITTIKPLNLILKCKMHMASIIDFRTRKYHCEEKNSLGT